MHIMNWLLKYYIFTLQTIFKPDISSKPFFWNIFDFGVLKVLTCHKNDEIKY